MNKAAIDQAKRRLDKALSSKNDIMLAERPSTEPMMLPAWQDLYYAHPASNNARKQLERLMGAYEKQFGKASDALIAAINEAISAANDVVLSKAAYEEAKADKAAAKVEAAAKRKAPPVILQDRRKNDQVVAAITEVANGFKVSVKAQFADIYRRTIGMWQEECAKRPGKTNPSTFWPYSGNRFSYMFNQAMRTRVSLFLNTESRPFSEYSQDPPREQEQLRYSLKPQAEVDAIIEQRTEQEATDAIQGFIFKMTAKLGGILDAKGDFEQVQVTGDLGRNSMVFSFADDSSFTVVNDIIINRSNLGTVFNQYPTRFTGVKIAGPWMPSGPGEHGSSQSEAWMKKNFKATKVDKQTEGWIKVIRGEAV